MVAGVAAAIGALVIGATAFAGGRPSSSASGVRLLAIGRAGRTAESVTPGSRRDVTVLDAGTISLTVDASAAAFKVDAVKAATGWTADVLVHDGAHVAVVFTTGTRQVDVSLALDARVVVVTITDVPQGSTPATSATTVAPSTSSSSSPSTVSTTTTATTASAPTAAATTATVATVVSTTAVPTTVAAASTTTIGVAVCRSDGDDEQDDRECVESDEHHTTTQSSVKTSSKQRDDKDDDDHGSRDD